MSNPLFHMLGGQNSQYTQMISQFEQFKRQFSGLNPREEVMKMLQSGKISQQQLNYAQNMANQLQNVLK